MPREFGTDFDNLKQFIASYSLESIKDDPSFTLILSQQHKKYYSYLTYVGELQNIVENPDFTPIISRNQITFFRESCSDVGISLFSLVHGSYKASKVMLRSSIETFFKGFFYDEIPHIDQITSVFELFRTIKALPFYLISSNKAVIDDIHQHYKTLCSYVHTSSIINMSNISAMNYFPTFDLKEASIVNVVNLALVPDYLYLLGIKYNIHFHQIHFKNKAIIKCSIPKNLRPYLNNILT